MELTLASTAASTREEVAMFAPLVCYHGLIHCDSDCSNSLCAKHVSQDKRDEAARYHLPIVKQPMSHMCQNYAPGREA